MTGSRTPLRAARFLSIALLTVGGAVLPATAGQAADAERITKYDVDMVLKPDGSMHVQETINYDFGTSGGHHGITRNIPIEFTYDEERVREYPISNIKVSSPTGAPADLAEDIGATASLRIGDPTTTPSPGRRPT